MQHRSTMIEKDNKTSMQSITTAATTMIMEGLILRERHVANMVRELILRRDDNVETPVLLHAERFEHTAVWMTVKKARQLLYPGVRVRIQVVVEEEKEEKEEKEGKTLAKQFYAYRIQILSVHPSTPYLARVLSFSNEELQDLFPDHPSAKSHHHQQQQDQKSCLSLPSSLVAACAPIDTLRLQQAYQIVQTAKARGAQCNLFKHEQLKSISMEIFAHLSSAGNNDLILPKSTANHPPSTSKETYHALDRFEKQWNRGKEKNEKKRKLPMTAILPSVSPMPKSNIYPAENGATKTTTTGEDATSTTSHHALLDPLHNLPDPTDERRRRYIDERKRPQIQCMLQFIQELLSSPMIERQQQVQPNSSGAHDEKRPLHIIDVGGGRGYLGLAMAGTFANAVHVTVVDSNPTSLQAGRERAISAQLPNISFVLCDLDQTPSQVDMQLYKDKEATMTKKVDLVVGLHCCGGLAEAAVELAIRASADFCVSTCCFRSNSSMATLTRLSEQLLVALEGYDDEALQQQYVCDIQKVAALAVTVGAKRQERAIRAYNNMRLLAAESRSTTINSTKKFRLETWQEQFPTKFSVQNAVLMGRHVRTEAEQH